MKDKNAAVSAKSKSDEQTVATPSAITINFSLSMDEITSDKYFYETKYSRARSSLRFKIIAQIDEKTRNVQLFFNFIFTGQYPMSFNYEISILNEDDAKNITLKDDIIVLPKEKRKQIDCSLNFDELLKEEWTQEGKLLFTGTVITKSNKSAEITSSNESSTYSVRSKPKKPKYASSSNDIEGKYAGLLNQGATCYMNSLLQSLFHLPSFRLLVYHIPTTGSEDILKSIPLNLQRLFYQMQFVHEPASTKHLTKSFGWDRMETFQQHDVQEFCRVLIDNLENKLKGTDLSSAIPNLFCGHYRNYIRCTNVTYQSTTTEKFYDLSMVVKGCRNLQESFEKYVEKELLDGENQYQTDDFGKQDAEMGTEFIDFPTVLHLHLRRFEFDYSFMRNVKINSEFQFPDSIDLSEYLIHDADRSKPWVYDLYGVLVHSGGVGGGHYYAFLRTSTDPQWYKFNDSMVTRESTETAIQGNFGGSSKYYSAYMLIYVRRCEAESIFNPIPDESVPSHLKEHMEKLAEEEKKMKEMKKIQSNIVKVTIFTEDNIKEATLKNKCGFEASPVEPSLEIPKQAKLNDFYQLVADHMKLPVNQIRIFKAEHYSRSPSVVIKNSTEELNLYLSYTNSLIIYVQSKKEDENVDLPEDSIVLFIKFYFPNAEAPLQYIGSLVMNQEDLVKEIIPNVNELVGFPKETELFAFLEFRQDSAKRIEIDQSFFDQYIETGNILIFQVPPGATVPPTSLVLSTPIEKSEIKIPDGSINAFDILPEINTGLVDYYFDLIYNLITVSISALEDQSNTICDFSFPASISFAQLKRFIVIVSKIEFDPERDSILLYKIDPYSDEPTLIRTDGTSAMAPRYMFSNTKNSSKNCLFFQVCKDISEERISIMSVYRVQFSKNGVDLDFNSSIVSEKNSSTLELIKNLKQRGVDVGDGPYQCHVMHGSYYSNSLELDDPLHYVYYPIRIDACELREDVVQVCECEIDEWDFVKYYGTPFFLEIVDEEFGLTKKRIQEKKRLSDEDFAKFTIQIKQTVNNMAQGIIAKDDMNMKNEVTNQSAILLVNKFATHKNDTYRRKEASLKIYN